MEIKLYTFNYAERTPWYGLSLLGLWHRITGEEATRAHERGHTEGWRRGISEAAAYCERYGARHHDIRRAALEVCAEHIRGVLPKDSL